MKHYFFFILACLLTATSCSEKKHISDVERYGNTFIKMSNDVFYAPNNWKSYVLGDGEFEIQLPSYMRDNSMPHVEGAANQTYLFNYRDTTRHGESHYGRVAIDFIKNNFNLATDYVLLTDQYDFWEPIVQKALKGGKGADGFEVPDGKLLNGPICNELELRSNVPVHIAPVRIYNACYRRGGHIKGEGPVSVNMFLLMNKLEATMITISYHDKDSVLFKDLFNVVKTFKWKEIYQ